MPSKQGIVFAPSAIGVELFMWAHGKGQAIIAAFLNSDMQFKPESDIMVVDGYEKKDK